MCFPADVCDCFLVVFTGGDFVFEIVVGEVGAAFVGMLMSTSSLTKK